MNRSRVSNWWNSPIVANQAGVVPGRADPAVLHKVGLEAFWLDGEVFDRPATGASGRQLNFERLPPIARSQVSSRDCAAPRRRQLGCRAQFGRRLGRRLYFLGASFAASPAFFVFFCFF